MKEGTPLLILQNFMPTNQTTQIKWTSTEIHKLPKVTQEEIDDLSKSVIRNLFHNLKSSHKEKHKPR